MEINSNGNKKRGHWNLFDGDTWEKAVDHNMKLVF